MMELKSKTLTELESLAYKVLKKIDKLNNEYRQNLEKEQGYLKSLNDLIDEKENNEK